MDISVVINGYRRPNTIREQYEAILNQTIKPKEILFWQNHYPNTSFDSEVLSNCKSTISNTNFGVWSRFSYALNCKSKYICIFDDDTVPGEKWFENCLETLKTHNGLLGDRGIIFNSNDYWDHRNKGYSGREIQNLEPVKVDIVGHAWFFEREWLAAYWSELPPPDLTLAGEDMHFSYMLQKRLGINTYVPPHPEDRSYWGSIKGSELGGDSNATSGNPESQRQMAFYLNHIVSKGFKLIKDYE